MNNTGNSNNYSYFYDRKRKHSIREVKSESDHENAKVLKINIYQ